MMRVVARGLIFDATRAPASQRSNAFTSLTATSNGYLASFRSAPGRDIPGGRLRIMGSQDGSTWSAVHEGLTKEIEGIEGDMYSGYVSELRRGELTGAFVWVDRSDPRLSFVHPGTAGILSTRNLLARSVDGGATWNDWTEVDLGPEQGCTITVPIFVIAPGVLGLPYETWKAYEDRSPGRHTASLRVSRDGGASWNERRIVAANPDAAIFYWDQRIAVNGDTGEAVAMFWTHDRTIGQDIPNTIAWAPSADAVWSHPVSCGWEGQHCQPLWLGGERLFAVHVDRGPLGGIIGRLSEDFGRHWDSEATIQVYSHDRIPHKNNSSGFEQFWQEMMTWQFGHPRAVLTNDGDVLVAWYAGDDDSTSVHWARIAVDAGMED